MIEEPTGSEEFVSEPIQPVAGTGDVRAMGRGEPGLPARFVWRGREYTVAVVVKAWKTSTREGGTGELYLRRHWYTIQTRTGENMTLYCERQARDSKHPKSRWWLYTMHGGRPPGEAGGL